MPEHSSFDYATIRVVPRVDREEFVNVGVILYCATRAFLGARIVLTQDRTHVVQALSPGFDVSEVEDRLTLIPLICAGDPAGGPIAQIPQNARFHWLVAPRSTVIQTSPVHTGLSDDPEAELEHLVKTMVGR